MGLHRWVLMQRTVDQQHGSWRSVMPDPPISFLNNIVYLPVEGAADVPLCSSSIAHDLMAIIPFKLDTF